MDAMERKLQIGFYENELCCNILPFWLERCEDRENGGYVNCFSNDGSRLVSTDKFIWSQGRFVWVFSHMAGMERPFRKAERERFLELAKSGRDFLVRHGFCPDKPLRCVFLTDAAGNPKLIEGYDRYDLSTGADGFAIIGLCEYARVSGDRETYEIVKELYESTMEREESGNFGSYPYPISNRYVQHGLYMGWVLRSYCMALAAERFEPGYAPIPKQRMRNAMDMILNRFVDENDVLHEVLYKDFSRVPGAYGNFANPGHTLEELWFIQNGTELLGEFSCTEHLGAIARKTFRIGWDETYGGLYHFCATEGGQPVPGPDDPVEELTYRQMIGGWGDKLWWAQSEALYSSLLFGERLQDRELQDWYRKLFQYTFQHYPNPDREIREWVQILDREGKPQDKVTGLPVKDPFHIIRNLICILEFLYRLEEEE